MTENLVDQGLELLVFGMGTVLVFLTVLVIAIAIMSTILERYFPEIDEPAAPAIQSAVTSADHPDLLLVIGAAVHRYRSKK